jgi:hypothetical protein
MNINEINYETESMTILSNKVDSNEKYIVVHVEGGLGKNVAATALIEGINKKYPDRKLVLVCSYPQIFLYHPGIYRVYALGTTPYFYEDYIKDKDVIVLKQDPYSHTLHIKQEQSLIKSWYEVFGLTYEGQLPILFSNYRMLEIAAEKWKKDKPILVIHTNGGPYHNNNKNAYNHYNIKSWSRDMPSIIAEKIIATYSNTHHIYQVCKTEENVLKNTEPIFEIANNFELFALLFISDRRFLIDSCLQHAAAALKLPSTVLWNGTSPKVFGYEIHNNILPNKEKMPGFKNITSYLYESELWGDPIQCPWNTNDIYDIHEIIEKTENRKI